MKRILRCGKLALGSKEIPSWLKVLVVIALLPIPGPLDELAGLIALITLAIFYRPILAAAWESSK